MIKEEGNGLGGKGRGRRVGATDLVVKEEDDASLDQTDAPEEHADSGQIVHERHLIADRHHPACSDVGRKH